MSEGPDPQATDLGELRTEIDTIDSELIRLLARRADLAQAIGRQKGLSGQPFYTPERERQIYSRLSQTHAPPLEPRHLVAIFREIISAARSAEKALTVAFWGPEGTFSHEAAVATFGRSTVFQPVGSIRDVFLAVERHQADYGVVPIENSTAGVVPETLDMFSRTNVKICAETFLDIHHHLAGQAASLAEVRTVYAGPQPAAQCRQWLRTHLPEAELVDVTPTARAAERATQDPASAAIVGRMGAERYGLTIIAERIEDHSENRTRFAILGENEPAQSGQDKTSIVFNLRNRPGELYEVLGSFLRHSVNLLMIESRPASRAAFEYLFYVDCAGHRAEANVAAALEEIRARALEMVVLGSYPSSDPNLRSG